MKNPIQGWIGMKSGKNIDYLLISKNSDFYFKDPNLFERSKLRFQNTIGIKEESQTIRSVC